jgi:protein-disulfide isomerase
MDTQQKKGFFDQTTPKLSFTFGLVTGLAVLSVIGFVVLLAGKAPGAVPVAIAPTPAAPVAAAAPAPGEPPVGDFRPVSDSDHVQGSADARVTLIEYSDLECPFCKRFHESVKDVMAGFDGQVRWVYRHFPLDSLHRKARPEAIATECAAKLGGNDAFWSFTDRIFTITPSNDGLNLDELPVIAAQIGLDRAAFETCLTSGEFDAHVQADTDDAIAAGGRGTPYSLLIGPEGDVIPVSGAVPTFQLQEMIDSLLN